MGLTPTLKKTLGALAKKTRSAHLAHEEKRTDPRGTRRKTREGPPHSSRKKEAEGPKGERASAQALIRTRVLAGSKRIGGESSSPGSHPSQIRKKMPNEKKGKCNTPKACKTCPKEKAQAPSSQGSTEHQQDEENLEVKKNDLSDRIWNTPEGRDEIRGRTEPAGLKNAEGKEKETKPR